MIQSSERGREMAGERYLLVSGERGIVWQYYVDCEEYWRKWVELNRN